MSNHDSGPSDNSASDSAQPSAPVVKPAQDASLAQQIATAVHQAMEVALAHHRGGDLAQAEDAYRVILELAPDHGDANHNLAVIALESGHAAAAVALFRKALDGQSENLTYWVSWFDALLQSGDLAGAMDALDHRRRSGMPAAVAQELMDRLVSQRHQSATRARAQGASTELRPKASQIDEINRLFQGDKLDRVLVLARALTRRFPRDGFGWKAMGAALINLGRCEQALEPLRQAVVLMPDDASALSNLGFALQIQGFQVESEVNLRLALKFEPNFAAAHVNLGASLLRQERYDEAAMCFRRSLELEPGYAPAYNYLAQTDEESGHLVDALAGYRRTLALQYARARADGPPYHLQAQAYAHQGVCSSLAKLADFTDVRDQTDKALALFPDDRILWEMHLYYLSYHPDMDVADIFSEFVRWGDRFPVPEADFSAHDRTPGRKLRIGYVSPDFRRHTSRFYFYPFFSNHDHDEVELFAYSNVNVEDDITARFRGCFDHWRDIRGLGDKQAAALIRADGIDILVDACNHMRDERLGVFALKPAPIQATWLGAAWTTGLKAVDYVLFDPYIAPPETLARENIVRLPHCFVPFQPLDVTDEPRPPPCVRNGHVTFAYSGRSERLNHHTFRVWGEILRRMPTARLILDYRHFAVPDNQAYFLALLQAQGVDTSRVEMRRSANIFQGLHDFDILLDSFPHSGGTMLLDALWMGVPALTLAGRPPLGRIGTTFMHNIGLPQWVAKNETEYVDKACAFAADVASLTQLRAGMRARLLGSDLMDGKGFVRGVELAYRSMWARFCAGESPAPIDIPPILSGSK
jgi:predicted O-linked N-acetylglucosamine transferase (SPINDLY family)